VTVVAGEDEVGGRIESAPILGGLRKRKDTGRRAHRHEAGLVVEDKDGTVALPYVTTQVFATVSPLSDPGSRPPIDARWTFVRDDGARWSTGTIDRATPLAQLCAGAARASAEIRLVIARERLAAGEPVDFRTALVTAQDVVVHGEQSPLPWSEVTGIEHVADEPAWLHTANRSELMMTAEDVADLAVLIALVQDRR
jgi:hypothetical protein